jgi:glycosyltransferase involved in cell wall biosynthesis
MTEMPPQLSVVVCTHNRSDDLARCLEALARLDEKPQVIVVDSASEPPCEPLVAGYKTVLPGLVYEYEPEPGLSRARNRGVARACGPIVAFLDDDAAPRPDWSREIATPFARNATIGCVGGACVAFFEGDAERPRWLSERPIVWCSTATTSPSLSCAPPAGPVWVAPWWTASTSWAVWPASTTRTGWFPRS